MPRKQSTASQATFTFGNDSVEDRVSHNHVHVRKSTFLAGLSQSVHRWFRLTPSYGPDLVQKMLADMATDDSHTVLDPFSGAGTTVIESKMEGISSVGFEINPLLHFVCDTCTRWDISESTAREALRRIEAQFYSDRQRLSDVAIEDIGIPLPLIHNVYRWWRPDVLKELLILREIIAKEADAQVSAFFRLAFAGVLVPDLTNVTLGRLQLHFINRDKHDLNVWWTYVDHANRMIDDLAAIPEEKRQTPAKVYHADSTSDDILQVKEKVHRVITSPP